MSEPRTYTQEDVDALLTEKLAEAKAGNDTAFKNLWDEAKRAKEALKNYEGIDPTEHKRLKEAAADAERKKAAAEGDFKSLEAQLLKKMEEERSRWDTEGRRLRSALEAHLIDAEATRELAQHSDSPGLLLPHVKRHMQVVENDGQFYARVVDDKGNVRIGKGPGATPMTLGELMEEMRQDKTYAPAFRGTGSSGGGASRSTAGGGGGSVRTIAAGDPNFSKYAKQIANGEVTVLMPQE